MSQTRWQRARGTYLRFKTRSPETLAPSTLDHTPQARQKISECPKASSVIVANCRWVCHGPSRQALQVIDLKEIKIDKNRLIAPKVTGSNPVAATKWGLTGTYLNNTRHFGRSARLVATSVRDFCATALGAVGLSCKSCATDGVAHYVKLQTLACQA